MIGGAYGNQETGGEVQGEDQGSRPTCFQEGRARRETAVRHRQLREEGPHPSRSSRRTSEEVPRHVRQLRADHRILPAQGREVEGSSAPGPREEGGRQVLEARSEVHQERAQKKK